MRQGNLGKQSCKKQLTIGLEDTVIERNFKGEVVLVSAAIALLLFVGLPATAQETGESLFKGKCAMCHGPDGAGKTKMGEMLKIPDLHSPEVQKKSDADLNVIIAKGKDKMPAYEAKLSKDQIVKLVAYVRDLAKQH
jgi:mono/diheme cytochrome c family protein